MPARIPGRECVPIRSIRMLNQMSDAEKRAILRRLIPSMLLRDFGIDPIRLLDAQGRPAVEFEFIPGTAYFIIRVRPVPEEPDCALYLQLADTQFSQLELLLVILNNLRSERFHVDRDEQGNPTQFGTLARNIPEEIRAMKAGLAPGQVRRGLGLLREVLFLIEDFTAAMGHDTFFLTPLAYHTAVLFERYGCGYVQRRVKMEWIDREFRPGGELWERLDRSSPFRQPELAHSVRGRSWAIHDGILGEPWNGVRMYKRVGYDAGIRTVSPDIFW